MIGKFIPISATDYRRTSPWSINPPRSLTREKTRAWEEYKELRRLHGRDDARTTVAWQTFTAANNNIKTYAINSQKGYEREIVGQLSTTPKLFHNYIRHRRVGRPSLGPLRLADGTLSDNPLTMSNCFVSSFAGVYENSIPPNRHPHASCPNRLPPPLHR